MPPPAATPGHPRTGASAARGLVLSCHPVPTVAVTAMATVLAVVADNAAATVLLVLSAVLTGQLSIGWSNDLIDAERDSTAARTDKPYAAGDLPRTALLVALVLTTAATVVLSLTLGRRAALAQLTVVACGWLYNVGLKSSLLSPLVYAVAFGALPAVATLALPAHPWPPWWVLVTGALLGVAAHFGNVLPDLEDDVRAGVRGVPHRIGRTGSAWVAASAVVVGAGLVLLVPDRAPGAVELALGALAVALAVVVVAVSRRGHPLAAAFGATMAAAAVCVALLALSDQLV